MIRPAPPSAGGRGRSGRWRRRGRGVRASSMVFPFVRRWADHRPAATLSSSRAPRPSAAPRWPPRETAPIGTLARQPPGRARGRARTRGHLALGSPASSRAPSTPRPACSRSTTDPSRDTASPTGRTGSTTVPSRSGSRALRSSTATRRSSTTPTLGRSRAGDPCRARAAWRSPDRARAQPPAPRPRRRNRGVRRLRSDRQRAHGRAARAPPDRDRGRHLLTPAADRPARAAHGTFTGRTNRGWLGRGRADRRRRSTATTPPSSGYPTSGSCSPATRWRTRSPM